MLDQSWRRVFTGSDQAALRAGTRQARQATAARKQATPEKVVMSVAGTP